MAIAMNDEWRIFMKLIGCTVLLCGISLMIAMTAFSQKRTSPSVSVEGTYENLTIGEGSGDLEGMRIILIDGGGGIYAIVQEAAGGVELPAPALAEVAVKGTDISFTIKFPGQDEAESFSGKVSAAGLRLRRGNSKQSFILKRRKC
jgi:hypothetical protein